MNTGELYCWGYNSYGNLGDGTTTTRSSPTQIPGTTWASANGGEKFLGSIKSDGTLWNGSYQH